MKIALLSDTHSHMDERILEMCRGCDEIWHAGDIGNLAVTDALEKLAPVRAVYGNIDDHVARRTFPLHQRFEINGLRVWITHIGGYPGRYNKGIREELAKGGVDLFICGHSHILKVMYDQKHKLLHMNPGAAGISGFHKVRTMLRFQILEGKVTALEAIELGTR